MKTLRTSLSALLGLALLTVTGCYAPPQPPPPRVHVAYEPPVYQPPKIAVQFFTAETGLTSDQIESRREEALRYLRQQGYVRDHEVIVDDATVADRVLYVSPSQQIGGGYDVRVFTPGDQNASAYRDHSSGFLDDDWGRPRVSSSITIINPRPYYGWGYRAPFYYDPFDPFFPRSSFFYYRDFGRPYYPRHYGPSLGYYHYPRYAPRHHHRPHYPRSGSAQPPQQPAPEVNSAPSQREPLQRPRREQP